MKTPTRAIAVSSNTTQDDDPDIAEIWKAILRPGAADDEQFVNRYYNWRRPISIHGLLGQPRTWMSWSYKAAYPKLSTLLEQASLEHKLRCRVMFEELAINNDLYQLRKLTYNEAHAPLSVIFDALKRIPEQAKDAKPDRERIKGTAHVKRLARVLHVTDISPLVLNCIFGTSSSLDISHVAAFVDRNLNGMNWAKVNLLQMRNTNWSSYTYEYHFSFYYVTLDYFEPDTVKPDPRHIRRSCPFGKRKTTTKHRYIHEESVSFLLCGYFDDAFTCYQLGDAYYRPRYTRDTAPRFFRSYDPAQSPGQLFLYWIAVALFHARSRWENAIDALDAEIKSPSDVVFMEDRSDLMADDPQFSLSKTYFWALQTYKLFERTLEQTIATWENFKVDSLPKVQDGRISPENWDAGVKSIDQSIELLKPKIARIRRGIQDVKDLREGLQSTAAVFDSRTAVRQGENIRLLTYITLLFLPLSFGTGIFSMQIIEPSPTMINAFAITLPVITIVTFLLIFNLNTLMGAFDTAVGNATFSLRRQMKLHHRKDWKYRAIALHHDHLSTEPPVRRAAKQSSHWVYMLFLIEVAAVVLPVSELAAALHCYGLFDSGGEGERDDDAAGDNTDREDASTHYSQSNQRKEFLERVKRAAQQAEKEERRRRDREKGLLIALFRRFYRNSFRLARVLMRVIFVSFRILLLPIWIILLLIEFILISIILILQSDHNHIRSAQTSSSQPPPPAAATHDEAPHTPSPFHQAWRTLGLNTLSIPSRHRHRDQHDAPYSSRSSGAFSLVHTLESRLPVQTKEQPLTATSTSPAQPQPVVIPATDFETKQQPQLPHPHDSTSHPPSPVTNPPEALSPEEDTSSPEAANVELSVFGPERPRRTIGARISRAANYARHGAGFIPGDFERAER